MGPPPVCRPAINDWAVFECGSCPFEAPELRPIKIAGVVRNHPILEDGPIITTLVQMIDQANSVARTLSTEYELGTPSAACAAQLAMLGGAPLKYISERATRVAEQLATRAALPRVSAVQDNGEPPAEEGEDGGEEEEVKDASFSMSKEMNNFCTASATPLRHFRATSTPPLATYAAHPLGSRSARPLRSLVPLLVLLEWSTANGQQPCHAAYLPPTLLVPGTWEVRVSNTTRIPS